jgi:hypothetical protein
MAICCVSQHGSQRFLDGRLDAPQGQLPGHSIVMLIFEVARSYDKEDPR